MEALILLLGLGVMFAFVGFGGGDDPSDQDTSDGDSQSDMRELGSGDDVVIDQALSNEFDALIDDLLAVDEITRSTANEIYSATQFIPGPMDVATGGGSDAVIGSDQDDRIDTGADDDLVHGAPGDDRIWLGGGDDIGIGGAGDDKILGEAGDDSIVGGPGDDTIKMGDGHDVSAFGFEFMQDVNNFDGFVVFPDLPFDDEEANNEEGGNDQISGGNGDDIIADRRGSNSISGSQGDDILNVLDGDETAPDTVSGGWGSDLIFADEGDQIYTGERADTVVIWQYGDVETDYQVATIHDFTQGEDILWLEGSSSNLLTNPETGAPSPLGVHDTEDGSGAVITINDIPVVMVIGGQGMTLDDIRLST